jgi:hypothetical protein
MAAALSYLRQTSDHPNIVVELQLTIIGTNRFFWVAAV